MTGPFVRRAGAEDLGAIESLLSGSSLPLQGVRDHRQHFFVAVEGTEIIGTIGLEVYGEEGLLRSLVVGENHRSRGVGAVLYDRLLSEARELDIRRLVLLTTTAERYFTQRGFRRIPRSSITGSLAGSAEFAGACPATATCMELRIESGHWGSGVENEIGRAHV